MSTLPGHLPCSNYPLQSQMPPRSKAILHRLDLLRQKHAAEPSYLDRVVEPSSGTQKGNKFHVVHCRLCNQRIGYSDAVWSDARHEDPWVCPDCREAYRLPAIPTVPDENIAEAIRGAYPCR